MAIIESAASSVALSEAVRYVRKTDTETRFQNAIERAAEQTAEVDEGLDKANIFAIINTEEAEKVVEESIGKGEMLNDDDIASTIDKEVLSHETDCDVVLSEFADNLLLQMAEDSVLTELVQYSYLNEISEITEEISSDTEDIREKTNEIAGELGTSEDPDSDDRANGIRRQFISELGIVDKPLNSWPSDAPSGAAPDMNELPTTVYDTYTSDLIYLSDEEISALHEFYSNVKRTQQICTSYSTHLSRGTSPYDGEMIKLANHIQARVANLKEKHAEALNEVESRIND